MYISFAHRRARVDREADRRAAEAERVVDAGRDRRAWGHRPRTASRELLSLRIVGIGPRRSLRPARGSPAAPRRRCSRRRSRACSGSAGRSRGVLRERAGRTMLEALIDGQDHHLAGAGQAAGHHHAAQVCEDARRVGLVPGQNLVDAFGHGLEEEGGRGVRGEGETVRCRERRGGWDRVRGRQALQDGRPAACSREARNGPPQRRLDARTVCAAPDCRPAAGRR
jgi:hypothetical protein